MVISAGDLAPLHTVVRLSRPVDLRATLGGMRRGSRDRATVFSDGACWRAFHTPDGPATLRLVPRPAAGEVAATAWGGGAEWALSSAGDLLGVRDSLEGWAPRHPLLRDQHLRHPGLRVPRSGLVFDTLLPTVLEQKVTGLEARLSYTQLQRRYGTPAPGPMSLIVPPSASAVARIPSWEWHLAGVDQSRSRTAVTAAGCAARLEEAVGMSGELAQRRLRAIPGIGAWTAAEVAQRALGDADAVSVGDYHLAHFVGWALTGHRVDDDGMLELLEPYRPHRYRAVRLLELLGVRHPSYGPRMTVVDHRRK
ncbi:MAG TPA: DNA-3-methyladenine glycosylase 2 family protein [Mycobacteriales bacterium]|nr:DNA-3-methyladenine glycosylase 2 family protein [Mycobacteriales bacterium]